MKPLSPLLRAQSPYWADKFDEAYEMISGAASGQIQIRHPVAGNCTERFIERWTEAAWTAHEQLKFLAKQREGLVI
jgi:hypothetical protein